MFPLSAIAQQVHDLLTFPAGWVEVLPFGVAGAKYYNSAGIDSAGVQMLTGASGTANGIRMFDGSAWVNKSPDAAARSWKTTQLCKDGTRALCWYSSTGRLYCYNGTAFVEEKPAGAITAAWTCAAMNPSGSVAIAAVSAGRVWIRTETATATATSKVLFRTF